MKETPSSLPGVRLHWSVLPVALLVIWELAGGLLPASAPGYSATVYWLIASVVTAGFFAALLAHAVVARRHGQRVRGITLWLFGGVADLERDAASPGAEFRMAAAGPLASLGAAAVLGGVGWLLAVAAAGHCLSWPSPGWPGILTSDEIRYATLWGPNAAVCCCLVHHVAARG